MLLKSTLCPPNFKVISTKQFTIFAVFDFRGFFIPPKNCENWGPPFPGKAYWIFSENFLPGKIPGKSTNTNAIENLIFLKLRKNLFCALLD